MSREAEHALLRLYAFEGPVALLEGGILPGGSKTAEATKAKIIALCKREQQRQLKLYDAAIGKEGQ